MKPGEPIINPLDLFRRAGEPDIECELPYKYVKGERQAVVGTKPNELLSASASEYESKYQAIFNPPASKPSIPPMSHGDTDPWSPSYDPALDSPPPMPGHSYSFTKVPNVFVQEGTKLGNLVNEKNKAYGDSVKKSVLILEVFYPDGIKPSQYADAAAMIRVLDKLCRISQHSVQGADLGGEDPWKDIAGYGLRQVCMRLEDDRSK